MTTCATCSHWQGNDTTYRAPCPLAGRATAFDEGCNAHASRNQVIDLVTMASMETFNDTFASAIRVFEDIAELRSALSEPMRIHIDDEILAALAEQAQAITKVFDEAYRRMVD